MMLNLIDALSSFGSPVDQVVGIMAIAAIGFVGDNVLPTRPPTHPAIRPDAPEPNQ